MTRGFFSTSQIEAALYSGDGVSLDECKRPNLTPDRIGFYPVRHVITTADKCNHPSLFWVVGYGGRAPDWILAKVVYAYDAGRTVAVLALSDRDWKCGWLQLARIAGGFH